MKAKKKISSVQKAASKSKRSEGTAKSGKNGSLKIESQKLSGDEPAEGARNDSQANGY